VDAPMLCTLHPPHTSSTCLAVRPSALPALPALPALGPCSALHSILNPIAKFLLSLLLTHPSLPGAPPFSPPLPVPPPPPLQVPFPGSLHVTSQRLCFVFAEASIAPIKLPGKGIQGVAKKAAEEQQGEPLEVAGRLGPRAGLVLCMLCCACA